MPAPTPDLFKREVTSAEFSPLPVRPENIPEELKAQPWAVWIAEPRPNHPGKFNKAPRNPVGGFKVGTNQAPKFGTFDEAVAAYNTGKYSGIGVLLTGNGIVGVDIDNYKDTVAAQPSVKQWIKDSIAAGAYCEKSPSGNGMRLFMRGSLPAGRRKSGTLEIYEDVRFLTVTGHIVSLKSGSS